MSEKLIDNTENQGINTQVSNDAIDKKKKRVIALIIVLVVIIVAGLIYGAIVLFGEDVDTTGKVRDVFIIFMALEMLVVGVAVVILMIQMAVLTNLINNEVKPILNSTTETVNTLKGTVRFLSDNLTEPVIKVNQTMAVGKKLFDLLKPKK